MRTLKKRLEIAASKFGDSGHPACEGIKSRTTESLPKQGNRVVLASTLHFTKHTLQRKITAVMLAITLIFTFSNCDKLRKIDFDELRKIDCNKEIGDIVPTGILKRPVPPLIPQQNLVITTSAAWDSLLNEVGNITAELLSRADSIDFSTQQVIAVFSSSVDGTWWTEIVEIKEYACHIVVTYHTWKYHSSNGLQTCHVVKIPATNKPIVFEQKYDESPNVPYAICPEYPPYWDTTFLRAPAYLFVDSIPANYANDKDIMHIVYYPTQDSTAFKIDYRGVSPFFNWIYRGKVCNLPDSAKAWNIPPQGKKVYCIGEFYMQDTYSFSEYGYYILTHLKDTVW